MLLDQNNSYPLQGVSKEAEPVSLRCKGLHPGTLNLCSRIGKAIRQLPVRLGSIRSTPFTR